VEVEVNVGHGASRNNLVTGVLRNLGASSAIRRKLECQTKEEHASVPHAATVSVAQPAARNDVLTARWRLPLDDVEFSRN